MAATSRTRSCWRLLEELRSVPNVIVDESFIHFACEGDGFAYRSVADQVGRFPNLMVVKSMSKDFGVAGIRAGYAVMAPDRVRTLLDNGYLVEFLGPGRVLLRPVFPAGFPGAVRAGAHPVHPQLAAVLRRAGQDRWAARLPDLRQLRLGRAPRRPQCRGARLPLAHPPRDLHPNLRRQEGARSPASSSGSPPATAPRTPTSSARCAG